jgi:hypothetical protein
MPQRALDELPVANAIRQAQGLLLVDKLIRASISINEIGRDLWLPVKHVVQLQSLKQIDDPSYAGILGSIQRGHVAECQWQALRFSIIGKTGSRCKRQKGHRFEESTSSSNELRGNTVMDFVISDHTVFLLIPLHLKYILLSYHPRHQSM